MKVNQNLMPKYWVGRHKECDDVLLHTARKRRSDVVVAMEESYGEDWFMDENFNIILVEISEVIF